MKATKLRVARATNDLQKLSEMYRLGLELQILGQFKDHDGFDGIMLGIPGEQYHFEFTYEKRHPAPRSHSPENLLVFYIPDPGEWARIKKNLETHGFLCVPAHNPYWDENGCTFEDFEGYRIVLCHNSW